MSDAPPMEFVWNGERSVMEPRRRNVADRTYVDGETYRLGVIEERSANSHNHYFAALAEAYANLPDHLIEQFPTVEHLRKYALIKTGYADQHTLVCSSKAEAQRFAKFLKPVDEFSVVIAREATVTRYTAKSQSLKAMGREDFQLSKAAVLDYVASLIGTSARELEENVGVAK
jgi:hypothetical protein